MRRLIGRSLLLGLVPLACKGGDTRLGAQVFQGSTMGTTFTVKVVAPLLSAERKRALQRRIEAELEAVNTKMSTFLEDSELSRFNRFTETAPFAVSPETFEVFRIAREVSELSGGAFDVTVLPLVNAWGFGPEKTGAAPTDAEIARLRERIGYLKVDLKESGWLRKSSPLVTCDLSAIAAGYAVDRVAAALEREGFTRFMIEVGGEVRTGGLNDAGEPWRIGIERPDAEGSALQRVVPLSGAAMATSGDYRNYREVDGQRISHTIDPRTGRPITHRLASVSVMEKLCARADALATALNVLGPDEGYALALKQDLAALFLIREENGVFRERATPAFERLAPPSRAP